MMVATDPFERIPEPLRQNVRAYADLVRELGGESVKSLTLFGAAAAGTFDARQHTVHNVLVLERVDLDLLRRLAEKGPRLGGKHISMPLVMTPAFIAESLDTFPLELLEIHQNHLTLLGQDYFADLTFADADVRLQCERELKVLLLGLRQALLAAAGHDKLLADFEQEAGNTLLRVLRGMLWLKGQRRPQPGSAAVAEIEKVLGRPLRGLAVAMDPNAPQGWEEFRTLYADVEALGVAVNGW